MVSDIINKTVSIFPALKKGGKKSRCSPINDYREIAATTEIFSASPELLKQLFTIVFK